MKNCKWNIVLLIEKSFTGKTIFKEKTTYICIDCSVDFILIVFFFFFTSDLLDLSS